MAEIRVDNPKLYREKKVDSSGKVYVGTEFADQQIRIVVESLEECGEGDGSSTDD